METVFLVVLSCIKKTERVVGFLRLHHNFKSKKLCQHTKIWSCICKKVLKKYQEYRRFLALLETKTWQQLKSFRHFSHQNLMTQRSFWPRSFCAIRVSMVDLKKNSLFWTYFWKVNKYWEKLFKKKIANFYWWVYYKHICPNSLVSKTSQTDTVKYWSATLEGSKNYVVQT